MKNHSVALGDAVLYKLSAADPVLTNAHGKHRLAHVIHHNEDGSVGLHVHLHGHHDGNQVAPGVLYWVPAAHLAGTGPPDAREYEPFGAEISEPSEGENL